MGSFTRELVFLVLQFLDEEKYKKTFHMLEQESGFFFNMKHFEDQVLDGDWEEVERYLSAFTKMDQNPYSQKKFFEIRKQKYFEALDRQDRAKALDILNNELKVFSSSNEQLYVELTQLLTVDDFRQNKQLSTYGDTNLARINLFTELKTLIDSNPSFADRRKFPTLPKSRLRELLNQSMNWQHSLCSNPRPIPSVKTLFIDHNCGPPNVARAQLPASGPLVKAVANSEAFPPLGHNSVKFQQAASAFGSWTANRNAPTPHDAVTRRASRAPRNNPVFLRMLSSRPTNTPTLDYQSADSERVMKRPRRGGQTVKDVTIQINTASAGKGPTDRHTHFYTADDLPKKVARILNEGSSVTSMDFHPMQQTILLVGTKVGSISIWEVGSRERLGQKDFEVWNIRVFSMPTQAAIGKDPTVSVNRTVWSPDGNFLGAAFSKYIAHIYSYDGNNNLRQHLEIDAHVGGVNDLAFSQPDEQLHVITCGDDKTIKVWDVLTGEKKYTFEGHEAPVYFVCPHQKETIHFIFSTAIDGNIKAWLYDLQGCRVDYVAPGHGCTTMAYSTDGTRLFSCGKSKEGELFLVEWNENEGVIKHTYSGFRKKSPDVVQFDTTRNRFLAVGDEFLIKIWDMDITNLLTTIEADGGLPESPQVRFNKEGSLLGVSSADSGIKILANADGKHLLRSFESRVFENQRGPPEPAVLKALEIKTTAGASSASGPPVGASDRRPQRSRATVSVAEPVVDGPMIIDRNPFSDKGGNDHKEIDHPPQRGQNPTVREDQTVEKGKSWKLTDISDAIQYRSIRLPDSASASKISRLIYTNSGASLVALCSSTMHKLWKLIPNEQNFSGPATVPLLPLVCQSARSITMTEDINDTSTNPAQETSPFIALSSNDAYLMSGSGGEVSILSMRTFKVMRKFMQPPPVATFLAIHPRDNNTTAIGMEDGTIQIFNVKVDEVEGKLKGHLKTITGLAFSKVLNVLVSLGADAKLCVWRTDGWEMRKSRFIQTQPEGLQTPMGDTRMQFHSDQLRLLVLHESQLAIYDVVTLERMRQWAPRDSLFASISDATYSCDSLLVYAGFVDGSVSIIDGDSLRPRCRLSASVHTGRGISGATASPLVIAAHPSDPNQFALGLSDGGVQVIEPLESGGWGVLSPSHSGNKLVQVGKL